MIQNHLHRHRVSAMRNSSVTTLTSQFSPPVWCGLRSALTQESQHVINDPFSQIIILFKKIFKCRYILSFKYHFTLHNDFITHRMRKSSCKKKVSMK